MVSIDTILSLSPHLRVPLETSIRSDCQSIIDTLLNISPVIMLNKHLHQIVREIGLLRDKWQVKIKPIKVKAH